MTRVEIEQTERERQKRAAHGGLTDAQELAAMAQECRDLPLKLQLMAAAVDAARRGE